MVKTILFGFLFIGFALVIANCRNKHPNLKTGSSDQEQFTITIASGGGFSGKVTGYTLSSKGELSHWERFPGKSESVLWVEKKKPKILNEMREMVEKNDLMNMKYREPGNMYRQLVYSIPDTSFTWIWDNTGKMDQVATTLNQIYDKIYQHCVRSENQ